MQARIIPQLARQEQRAAGNEFHDNIFIKTTVAKISVERKALVGLSYMHSWRNANAISGESVQH
jgi:hypothetical protein